MANLGLTEIKGQEQIGGRIGSNWEIFTNDPYVLDIVKGLKIDFFQEPPQKKEFNPIFSKAQKQQITMEVSKMLEKKAAQIVDPSQGQFVSHIFLATKKSGGVRPVINLKKLNQSGTNTSKWKEFLLLWTFWYPRTSCSNSIWRTPISAFQWTNAITNTFVSAGKRQCISSKLPHSG